MRWPASLRPPPRQAQLAAALGAAGAILVSILFTVLIALLIRLPYLNAIGGLILLWITWKLVAGSGEEKHRGLGVDSWSAV